MTSSTSVLKKSAQEEEHGHKEFHTDNHLIKNETLISHGAIGPQLARGRLVRPANTRTEATAQSEELEEAEAEAKEELDGQSSDHWAVAGGGGRIQLPTTRVIARVSFARSDNSRRKDRVGLSSRSRSNSGHQYTITNEHSGASTDGSRREETIITPKLSPMDSTA